MSSIVPLSRSPYRAPGTGEQARGQGRAHRPHAEHSRQASTERARSSAQRALDRERPRARMRGLGARRRGRADPLAGEPCRPCAARSASAWLGPSSKREVPGRLRDAAVSEAMRMARWPARERSTKADRPGGHRLKAVERQRCAGPASAGHRLAKGLQVMSEQRNPQLRDGAGAAGAGTPFWRQPRNGISIRPAPKQSRTVGSRET